MSFSSGKDLSNTYHHQPAIPSPTMKPAATRRTERTPNAVTAARETPGPRLTLATEVKYVRGVGPQRAIWFAALGVKSARDLIEHFPFRHVHKPRSKPIGMLVLDEMATVVGELRRVRAGGAGRKKTIQVTVIDGTGQCAVRWFNSPYLEGELRPGQIVRISGKVDAFNDRACFTNPEWSVIDPAQGELLANDRDEFEPVYSASAELHSRQIGRMIQTAIEVLAPQISEFLPDSIRRKRKLSLRRTAILGLHRPTREAEIEASRNRLAYEEFLLLQLAVQLSRRAGAVQVQARPIAVSEKLDARIRKRLPFELTPGQNKAVTEICADMTGGSVMNRLLQADVGAGKTAVAVYAALAAVANKDQVAMVAPTEVLARQHFAKLERYLHGSRVRTACLTGSISRAERTAIVRGLSKGEVDLIVGTHALFEVDVAFARLNLVIIDEQHKFGVAQRALLRQKGRAPHMLVLTATPIPRTLAMTLFGDLDASTIQGAPPGRQPVTTRLVTPDLSIKAWDFVRGRLRQHDQGYVVYPLVEESENLDLKSASEEAKRLAQFELADFKVGLLHGRMKPAEKLRVMKSFADGDIRVLVATTVIEVGVDVPNASLMIVQHAERYGLSQLHQLRGRVGRGSKRSYCLMFAESSGETSTARLKILTEVSDGFRIAEEDMRIRGPGEMMGTRQHGMPVFKVADLVRDFQLLAQARDDAAELLTADPLLAATSNAGVRNEVMRRYAHSMKLIDCG